MQIIMPKLGLTMTHGTITEWLKAPGDAVKAEEALCVYETEKVTLELTAPEDGVLAGILVPAGVTVPAGAPVCEFRTKGENQGSKGGIQPPASGIQPPTTASFAAAPIKATPLARRIAAAAGVDLAGLRGTGAEGTVTREDVELAIRDQEAAVSRQPSAISGPAPEVGDAVPGGQYAALGVPSPAGTRIPHSALRRTIADRMSRSVFTAPHVTLMTEAEATHLVSARAQLNQELSAADKISYNTLLAALTARALREHPGVNARWEAEGICLLAEINIALAVDTERGLLTPVLREVDRLDLAAVQRGYAELVSRALAGKSLPDDFSGGTFTITNLGGLDVDGFTPIINPPQAAILGVGRIVEKPVARDGAVVVRPIVTLSLSFDHRIVDGGPAAKFLQRIKQLVERPMALLLI